MRIFALLALVGCHHMSPPPLVMRHQGAQADAVGDTRIQLIVGINAGVLSVDTGVGMALQLTHQTNDVWKVGGNLGWGLNAKHIGGENKDQHPLWLVSARGFGRAHTGVDGNVAGEGGLGLGYTGNQALYLTVDGGGTFGGVARSDEAAGDLYAYGAPTVAVSIPVLKGQPILERPILFTPAAGPPPPLDAPGQLIQPDPVKRVYPKTTWFVFINAGLLHEIPDGDQAYGYSLELHQFVAFDERDGSYNLGLSVGGSSLFRD